MENPAISPTPAQTPPAADRFTGLQPAAAAPPEGQDAGALPQALDGERIRSGDVSCYVAGEGPPLLLVHSINAAASAADVRPLFERYGRTRAVFAPDLPGFGSSERADRVYDPRVMTDALHRIAAQIRQRCGNVDFTDFRAKALLRERGHWKTTVYPTGAMPYFEIPGVFFRAFDDFLGLRDSELPAPAGGTGNAEAIVRN